MAELKELYSKASKCSEYTDFINYSDFEECISDLKALKNEVPKEYPHYDRVQTAVGASLRRIELQKELKYTQYKEVSSFIKARSAHEIYSSQEKKAWQELAVARIEYQEKQTSTAFSDNLGNMAMIGILLLIIFVYRLIVSNKIQKLKYRNILRAFGLLEEAALVEKEVLSNSKYKIMWLGLRTKDENADISPLSPEETDRLNLIYSNMHILEEAFNLDISENKFNVWRGINLERPSSKEALSRFLNLINEKVKE